MAAYTQTYTFSNGQTADGGNVNTELVALGNSVNNIIDAQISASAAIAISKTALGTFTDWTAWTPTLVGWSGSPTLIARYAQIGKIVHLAILIDGTSNSTATSFTLPTTYASNSLTLYPMSGRAKDNGSFLSAPAMGEVLSAATVCTVYKDGLGTTWTASGAKTLYLQFSYETT